MSAPVWILLLVMKSGDAISSHSVEFNSAVDCRRASSQIIAEVKDKSWGWIVVPICLEKRPLR